MDPTSATEIVRQAGDEGGWMAAALALIMCTMVGGLIVLIKNMMARQTETERFVRGDMAAVIDDNSLAFHRLGSALRKRPCLMDSDLDVVIDGVEKDDSSLGEEAKRIVQRRKIREQRRGDENRNRNVQSS